MTVDRKKFRPMKKLAEVALYTLLGIVIVNNYTQRRDYNIRMRNRNLM